MHTWGDRTPRSESRQGTIIAITQIDEEKKGRKSNSVALQEMGALLINSGKIKKLFPHSPPYV
jgi:hypothetical protein